MSEEGDDIDGRLGNHVVDNVQQNDKLNGMSPQNSEDLNKDNVLSKDNILSSDNLTSDDTQDQQMQMMVDLKSHNEYLKSHFQDLKNGHTDSSSKALKQNGTCEDSKELHEKLEALNRELVIERQTRGAVESALEDLRAEYTEADFKSQELAAKLVEAEKNLDQQVKERDESNSEPDSKLNRLHRAKQRIQEVQKEKDDLAAQHREVNEKSEQACLQLSGLQEELVLTCQNASQYYQNSPFFSNPGQISFSQNPQTSQNTEKQPRTSKWDVAEDVALMSAWCIISGDSIRGKNKKKKSLWTEVKKLYDAAREENPKKLGDRNVDQMKGRFKRLNENVEQWVAAYQEAHRLGRSRMTQKEIENSAHKIYEQGGKKFHDSVVFNEVMCKNPKWALETPRDTTRSRREEEVDIEESGESTKRTRTPEEGDYCVNSNPETPTSGGSLIQRPTKKKKKGKGKVSYEIVKELRAMRLARDKEVDFMRKRLEFEQQKEQKKEERELKKMQLLHLNTLLQKEHLSFEEEQIKRSLMSKFYGN